MLKPKFILSLMLMLCLATVGLAQDQEIKATEKGKDKAAEKAIKQTTSQVLKSFERAELTDEQMEKIGGIIKENIQALRDARKAVDDLLTPEQLDARQAAQQKAKEEGLKFKESNEAVTAAMGLSEEQLAEFKTANKKPAEVMNKIKASVMELLTDEQRAMMPKSENKKGEEKKEKGKKKDGDGDDDDDGLQTVSLKLPNMT